MLKQIILFIISRLGLVVCFRPITYVVIRGRPRSYGIFGAEPLVFNYKSMKCS